ncbi:hypothetical protein [Propionivibrio limicola]|uniref:hypothetical protein n=1 Tax=Propionivibrio limicola TaxID=167645 RepID=UPI001291BF4F|nr:hypothetical protein [Propionivibrio limicola]
MNKSSTSSWLYQWAFGKQRTGVAEQHINIACRAKAVGGNPFAILFLSGFSRKIGAIALVMEMLRLNSKSCPPGVNPLSPGA